MPTTVPTTLEARPALFFLVMPDPASKESGNDAAASITGFTLFQR